MTMKVFEFGNIVNVSSSVCEDVRFGRGGEMNS